MENDYLKSAHSKIERVISLRINDFSSNLFLSNRINTYNKIVSSSLQKLSTGKRINSAADSPSDILRISRFESEVRGSRVAQRNIQDGISFLQVAEGALTEIQDIGQRLKELSVQYNSDVLTSEDKGAIEGEAKELLKEINHIIDNTCFGKLKVFEKNSYTIQTRPYSGDSYEIKLPDLSHLKEICIDGQDSPSPPHNNGNTGNVGDNDDDNIGGIDDNNNGNIGGIDDGNNDDDNTGDVGGVSDNDDDNGDIGGVDDGNDTGDDSGNVGGVGDDTGDVGGVDDGNDDGSGDVGGIDDDDNCPKDTSLNGYQKLYNKQGTLIYDGFMKNGEYHGYGKLYSDEGVLLYDGFWNNGIYDNFGKVYNEQGQIMYEGGWEDGKKQGFGKTFYSNGKIQYEGNWYNDVYNGWGKVFDENGKIEYEGEWVNGEPKTVVSTTKSSLQTTLSLFKMPTTATLNAASEANVSNSSMLSMSSMSNPINTAENPNIANETEVKQVNIQNNQDVQLFCENDSVIDEFDISDILNNDFVDENILKPISSAVNHVGVMENTLSLRLDSQINNEELKEDALSKITDVDMAKELMNYIKNQMLLETNVMLLHQNLSNQREYILQLLS